MALKYSSLYDFSNRGIDWKDYQRDVRLRTDAVWERSKLKDYFRMFYKIFYWDPKTEGYYVTLPGHSRINSPDNWKFKLHQGYSATGKTLSYEPHHGDEVPSRTISSNIGDALRDKNVVCFVRFRAYKQCEGNTIYPKIAEAPLKDGSQEPFNLACYQEMQELLNTCERTQINWLADLWHHLELQTDPSTFGRNDELKMMSDQFDNPDIEVFTY
jgi:hypothetical protein